MFIGRKEELKELNERLYSKKFEMIPIYGRRRVGKTRLLEEFVKDKKAVFFTADQFGEESNLFNLSQAIISLIAPSLSVSHFTSFQDAFEAVATYAETSPEPLVFIIDEYPYLAKSSEGISSVLQKVIDKNYLKLPNLMLILTGSQLSFMEEQVLGYESPLYGRRTGQIKLLSLNYTQSKAFLPSMPEDDFMTIYGLTGGIPLYLTLMDDSLSLKENIIQNVLSKNTFLYEEPRNLLMQELRTPNRYNDIIAAIAGGASEMKDIIGKTGIDSGPLTKYLMTLIDLNIIEKKLPLTKIGKNKPVYIVSDGLFRFWYRYVPNYRNFIETSRTHLIWNKIEEDLPQYTSIVFEEFCRDWLYSQNGSEQVPFLIAEVGSWWGNNPLIHNKATSQEEVDIIGLGLEKSDLIVGEFKWRKAPTDRSIAERLVERSHFFPYQNKALYLFSKTGFTPGLKEYAKEKEIQLIEFRKMIEE